MSEKLRSIETTPDKAKAAIEALRRALSDPDQMELLALVARHRKAQLDAYMAAGFTRDEALAIVMDGAA